VPELGLESVPLEPERYDCVAILTAHSDVDYEELVRRAPLLVDFRNATGDAGRHAANVWKL
jgi:UDP-N-acetyl-D-glucosamine dehydrogenase